MGRLCRAIASKMLHPTLGGGNSRDFLACNRQEARSRTGSGRSALSAQGDNAPEAWGTGMWKEGLNVWRCQVSHVGPALVVSSLLPLSGHGGMSSLQALSPSKKGSAGGKGRAGWSEGSDLLHLTHSPMWTFFSTAPRGPVFSGCSRLVVIIHSGSNPATSIVTILQTPRGAGFHPLGTETREHSNPFLCPHRQ